MLTRRLAAAALLALPSMAFAWGPEGHQVVALIAYAHLTPEAKAGTKALLGDGKDIYDAEVADWADIIRRSNQDLGPYHYVDANVEDRTIDLKRDGADGKNVVDGIVDQVAVLSGDTTARQIVPVGVDGSKTDTGETRAQALRWVVHLVGDAHQPLHCCDRNDDAGGNKVKVSFMGAKKETNLHAVWDGALLRTYVSDFLAHHQPTHRDARGTSASGANAGSSTNGTLRDGESGDGKEASDLTDYAMSLDARITPQQRKTWSAGTPLDWANESHLVGVKFVYGDLPRGDPVPIDAGYVARKKAIVEQQLERGGVRLAAVLNKAFATNPTTQPAR